MSTFFDKMSFQMCPFGIVIMLFGSRLTLECHQKNVSCKGIETAEGYRFLYPCPEGGEISVNHNGSPIALIGLQSRKHSNDVMSINNDSVTTRHCKELQIKCTVTTGNNLIEDICMNYTITKELDEPDPSNSLKTLNIGVSVGVLIGIIVIIGMFLGCFFCKKKRPVAPTVCGLSYLQTDSCLRMAESRGTPTSDPEGSGVQEDTAGDLDTTQQIGLREIRATDPRGSGENGIEPENTLGCVHVHSIDSKADGKTPPAFSLDRSLSEGIQPTKNGYISAPDIIIDSNHRAVNRSLRGDPGGFEGKNGKDIVRIKETHNGCALGDRGPEDRKNEGQPLLPPQGAALQAFDMTDEAVALVNKAGFKPNQVRRCSTAPDTDVESTPNMKNYEH